MTRDEWLEILPKGMVWAELGVFLGDFSKKIQETCQPTHLHLVDTFPSDMTSGDKDGNHIQRRDLSKVPIELSSYFKGKNVTVHTMTTTEFLNRTTVRDLDIVYIDADHSYEGAINDLRASLKRVKPSGIIAGHDYSQAHFPGVFQAVNEFCKNYNLKIDLLTDDKLPSFSIRLPSTQESFG